MEVPLKIGTYGLSIFCLSNKRVIRNMTLPFEDPIPVVKGFVGAAYALAGRTSETLRMLEELRMEVGAVIVFPARRVR